ncbi:MAG: metal-dependent hydrolase [Myxococcota bacterium]
MTTVGHTLTGLAIAFAALPSGPDARRRRGLAVLCALAANAPDAPLPGWGHDAYHVSHSLFVNAAIILAFPLMLRGSDRARRAVAGWRGYGVVAGAWMSHMLLDSFYNHGRGIAVFWPVSDAHLVLPIPWFSTVRPPWRSAHNLQVFGIELLVYGSVLLAALAWRHHRTRHGQPGCG